MLTPLTKMTVHIRFIKDEREAGHEVFEGEVPMTQPQQDYYKQLIGDGLASVTASREISESNYGNGGKVFVSVTLTCDQSSQMLATAIEYAKSLAEGKAWEHHAGLKQQLVSKGILQP